MKIILQGEKRLRIDVLDCGSTCSIAFRFYFFALIFDNVLLIK